MTSHTSNYSFPFPDLTDTPDGATETQNLAVAIDTQLHITDGNVSANTAALSRASLIATLLGTARRRAVSETNNPVASTSSAYVFLRDASSNILGGVAFVAPPSGSIDITFGMGISVTSGSTGTVSVALLDGSTIGSGTILLGAQDNNGFASTTTSTVPGAHGISIDGLTSGHNYNTAMLWKSSAGTTIAGAHVWLRVNPVLAS